MADSPFHAFNSMLPEQRHHMLVQSLRLAIPNQMVSVNGQALTGIVSAKALYDVVVMRAVAAHIDLNEARSLRMAESIIKERELAFAHAMLALTKAGAFGWNIKLETTHDAVDSPRPGSIITSSAD